MMAGESLDLFPRGMENYSRLPSSPQLGFSTSQPFLTSFNPHLSNEQHFSDLFTRDVSHPGSQHLDYDRRSSGESIRPCSVATSQVFDGSHGPSQYDEVMLSTLNGSPSSNAVSEECDGIVDSAYDISNDVLPMLASIDQESYGPGDSQFRTPRSGSRYQRAGSQSNPADAEAYASIIFECLLREPNYEASMARIYELTEAMCVSIGRNHNKNSIRHNLSTNEAFMNLKGDGPASKGRWRLTQKAIDAGRVEPTTRFRGKKARLPTSPGSREKNQKRQDAGKAGGLASAKYRKKRNDSGQMSSPRDYQTIAPKMEHPMDLFAEPHQSATHLDAVYLDQRSMSGYSAGFGPAYDDRFEDVAPMIDTDDQIQCLGPGLTADLGYPKYGGMAQSNGLAMTNYC